jgi:hypothetical protein
LCYVTRSVSYPAPTYYAHLAADRARKHHNCLTERGERNIDRILKDRDVKIMYFV